jgi:hypothetical protein
MFFDFCIRCAKKLKNKRKPKLRTNALQHQSIFPWHYCLMLLNVGFFYPSLIKSW